MTSVRGSKKTDESRVKKLADNVQATAEKLRENVKGRIQDSGSTAKARGVDLAISLVKLQRTASDQAFKALAGLQVQGDKLVRQHIQEADWMPPEGKDIVKEWSRMLNEGRAEFCKTLDKSFGLLSDGLERVRKEQAAVSKKPVAAKSAGGARKKSAPRKKKASVKKEAAK